MRAVDVTTWYLEMLDRDDLQRSPAPAGDVRVMRAEVPSPELNRFLYTAVGGQWYWIERLGWDYARWQQWLDEPAVETWVLYVCGTPAGYVELEAQQEGNLEIAYFGLLPGFVGQGLGGYLLSVGIERAWDMGARRVWVHTCSLDGPHALANYQARGMRVYDQRTQRVELPDVSPGPWPGAFGADIARLGTGVRGGDRGGRHGSAGVTAVRRHNQ
jgi:GNAT superfamily N-acetyltransferase